MRSVKQCLKKSIGRSSLKFQELRTLMVKIEATLNNRPLTYIYDDEGGISYQITPANLPSLHIRDIAISSVHSRH